MQQQWSGLGFSQSGTAGSISPELLLTASLADLSLENASLLAGQAYEAPHSQASLQLTTDPTGYLVDLGNGQLGLGSLQDLQATTLASSSYGGGGGLQFVTTSAQSEHTGTTFVIDNGGVLQQEWPNPQSQVVPIRSPNILGLPPHPLESSGSHALFGIEAAATAPQSASNAAQLQLQQLIQLQSLEAQVQVQAQAVQQRQQFLSSSAEQHLGSSPGWSLNSSTQVQRLLQSIGQSQTSNKRVGGSGPRVQVPGRAALGVSSQPNLHQQQQQPNSTSALRTSQGRQGSQSTTGKAPGSSIRAQPPSWAGADWNPRAAAQAVPATGTGVFLPRVAPATPAVPIDAASNGSQPNSALNASQPNSALNASQAGAVPAHEAATPSTSSTGANTSSSPVATSSTGGNAQLDLMHSTASTSLSRAHSAQPHIGYLGDLGPISRPATSMTGTPSSAAAAAPPGPSTASSPGAHAGAQDRDSAHRLGLQPQTRMVRSLQMPGGGSINAPMTLRLPQVPERSRIGGAAGAGGPAIPGTIAIPPPVAARAVGSTNMLGNHLMADPSARQHTIQQQLHTLHLADGPSSSPAAVMLGGLADGGLGAAGAGGVPVYPQTLGGDGGMQLSDLLPASLGLDQLFPHGLPPLSAASVQQGGHHNVRGSPGIGGGVRAQNLADSLNALAVHLHQQQQQQQLAALNGNLATDNVRPSSLNALQLNSGTPVVASLNALQQKAMEQALNPGAPQHHRHNSLLDTM